MTNHHHPHLVSKVLLNNAKQRTSSSYIQNTSDFWLYLRYFIQSSVEETTITFSMGQITVYLYWLDYNDCTLVEFKTERSTWQILTSSSYLTWMPVILTCTFFITWVASFSKKVSFFSSFGLSGEKKKKVSILPNSWF